MVLVLQWPGPVSVCVSEVVWVYSWVVIVLGYLWECSLVVRWLEC